MNNTAETDAQYLSLLSLFHYIVGGLCALCGCFPIIHLSVGIALVAGAFDGNSKNAPPAFMGWFFIVFAGAFILSAWTFAGCLVLSGYWLSRRRHYWFCFVVACIACAFQPFGTVLGVFTIVVLLRPTVKELFGLVPAA
jgi:hypothetical protein